MNREKILRILESHQLRVGYRDHVVSICTCGAKATRNLAPNESHREHLANLLGRE